jgi:hypothetical protein
LRWLRPRDSKSAETIALESVLSLVSEFLSLHREWSERMLWLESERLRLEKIRLEGARPLEVPSGTLRVSEDEQDLDWAVDQGIISSAEYHNLLAKTGLSPSDLEFN